ncbi:ATP-binding protein [Nocardia sp. alder85J]|uniref:ATP-binding protein n=1 Tax=Nocardia sp. alder85J TaxID=2862949 RepID=UPI001CD1A857|nr:ATP-binding protein [Nocardia sp. alder85J]MCX4095430.1 ATP-binding protein [Nocardia sp. alder85J]
MMSLRHFGFHRVLTVPAVAAGADGQADRAAQLFAALVAAHGRLSPVPGAAIAVAWERLGPGHRLRVLVGGTPYFPWADPEPAQPVPLRYPPGSTAIAVDATAVLRDWTGLPVWLRCAARTDVLWAPDGGAPEIPRGRGCFEDHFAHAPGEFVWLVLAAPASDREVDAELGELAARLPRLRAREHTETDRTELRRSEFRYHELLRARSAGLWAVRVLVGGRHPGDARSAAALLCGAADLDRRPYLLRPVEPAGTLPEVQDHPSDPGAEFRTPFLTGAEVVAALARPPHRELPGVRAVDPPRFDVTPEHDAGIALGQVLDEADRAVGPFRIALGTLNRHGFVAGATGSGKSQTVRHLLEGLAAERIPWLVIEPAKAEYAGMAGRLAAPTAAIRPGAGDEVPVGLNPLEPEPGFPLQTHLDLIRALFLAAFDAVDPFPQVLAHALTRCYTDLGWDTVLGEPALDGIVPRYPTLADLQATALAVVDGIGYGREVADNVRGFVTVRLGALRLGTPGRFFEATYPLDVGRLLCRNTVFELEDIGNDADKAFFIGVVLIRIAEHLRVHRDGGNDLRHVLVVEEAHRLLRRAEPGSPTAHAVELFTALLAEIRAYGEGIVVVEQIPAKIAVDVVKNTAWKIMHRLPAADDRDIVGATMNLDAEQSRHVVSLPPGRAVVFTDGMDRPVRVAVPLGQHREDRARVLRSIAVTGSPDTEPLVLRDLHRARRIAEEPRLALWLELMLLAHLVGRPWPRPGAHWRAALLDRHPRRLLGAALAHRLRTAVDLRYIGLCTYFQPEQLTAHLVEAALAALTTGAEVCPADETRWQAGRYRWSDVEYALHEADSSPDRPHPATDAWRLRGLILPGATVPDQLAALRTHPDSWADPAIVTGPTPTTLDRTLTLLSRAPDAEHRLRDATGHLELTSRWPLALLTDPAPRGTR